MVWEKSKGFWQPLIEQASPQSKKVCVSFDSISRTSRSVRRSRASLRGMGWQECNSQEFQMMGVFSLSEFCFGGEGKPLPMLRGETLVRAANGRKASKELLKVRASFTAALHSALKVLARPSISSGTCYGTDPCGGGAFVSYQLARRPGASFLAVFRERTGRESKPRST